MLLSKVMMSCHNSQITHSDEQLNICLRDSCSYPVGNFAKRSFYLSRSSSIPSFHSLLPRIFAQNQAAYLTFCAR